MAVNVSGIATTEATEASASYKFTRCGGGGGGPISRISIDICLGVRLNVLQNQC